MKTQPHVVLKMYDFLAFSEHTMHTLHTMHTIQYIMHCYAFKKFGVRKNTFFFIHQGCIKLSKVAVNKCIMLHRISI